MFWVIFNFGFVIKFMVLSFKVFKVVFVLFFVNVEIIIIGVGMVFIMIFKKCKLLIFGILIFNVIMFGLNFCIMCLVM